MHAPEAFAHAPIPTDAPSAELQAAVVDAFRPDGPLAQATEGFHARPGQVRMAQAVARTLVDGGPLVVEAATGVGKTFAYLVPALLSGERVLVSTATKALQDQLYERDLPRVASALGIGVRKALLKGRSSYLCLHRMEQAAHGDVVANPGLRRQLADIERWSKVTRSGDLAELPWLDERSPLMPLVTSTHENCLGADCPHFRDCHVNLARRQAMAADVVVINHHLFFADLEIRSTGMAELLPTVRCVVFDEAHKLNETGIQFLGQQLGTSQLLNLARDVLAAGLAQAKGLFDWRALASGLELAARNLRLVAGRAVLGARLRWVGAAPDGIAERAWQGALHDVHEALDACSGALQKAADLGPDFARLHERAAELLAQAVRFAAPGDPDSVRWVDGRGGARLVESPLDIAATVRTRLLGIAGDADADADANTDAHGAGAPEHPRAWVFVSATLGDDEQLSWFTGPCGLEDAEILRVPSPFDYPAQAVLYVPADFPRPGDQRHGVAVAELVAHAARRLGGRTLVLTTTLRALRQIGAALTEALRACSNIEVLVQGNASKRVLAARFRAGAGGASGCGQVLVASASFWEGLDVPGAALQLVVIDKLPFPPPGDPLVEARCKRIEGAGQSAFAHYSVPAAAVALKQGVGRLIRSETDRGAVVICDERLVTRSYGRRLLAALPPMRPIAARAEFDATLRALAMRAADSGVDSGAA